MKKAHLTTYVALALLFVLALSLFGCDLPDIPFLQRESTTETTLPEPQDSEIEPLESETLVETESNTEDTYPGSDEQSSQPVTEPETSPDTESMSDTEKESLPESETEKESATEPLTEPEVTPETTPTTPPSADPPNDREPVVDVSKAKYSYEEMSNDLAELKAAYPDLFDYYSIGTTADGRNIYVAVLGSGNASRQIVGEAGTHGREYLNPLAVMATLEYYLSSYEVAKFNGQSIKELLSDTDLYIIPMLNPDGITISQFGVNALNKQEIRDGVKNIYEEQKAAGKTSMSFAMYQQYWKANALGVDINRNFDTSKAGVTGADPEKDSPSYAGYSGTTPGSELETKAYMSLVNSLSNPIACISIHSQGEIIYWNCGQSSSDKTIANKFATEISKENGYTPYNTNSFTAASADWCMLIKGIPSVTVETGKGNCPLPFSQYEGIYASVKNLFLIAASLFNN